MHVTGRLRDPENLNVCFVSSRRTCECLATLAAATPPMLSPWTARRVTPTCSRRYSTTSCTSLLMVPGEALPPERP